MKPKYPKTISGAKVNGLLWLRFGMPPNEALDKYPRQCAAFFREIFSKIDGKGYITIKVQTNSNP